MDLAILLTAGPPAASVHKAWELARAAADRRLEAGVFMMDDGVYAEPVLAARVAGAGLAGKILLACCSHDAHQRGAAVSAGVIGGSQATGRAGWARPGGRSAWGQGDPVGKSVLVLVRHSPLNTTSDAESLRMALGLEIADHKVTVAFLDAGVFAARHCEPERMGSEPIAAHVEMLTMLGHRLWAEGNP